MILRLRDTLLDPASCESTRPRLALPYLTMYMPCHGRASIAVVVQDACSTGVQLPIVCPGRVHIIEDGPRSDPKVVVCFLT